MSKAVKLLTNYKLPGSQIGQNRAGSIRELPDELADELVEAGKAKFLPIKPSEPDPTVEAALDTLFPPEPEVIPEPELTEEPENPEEGVEQTEVSEQPKRRRRKSQGE